MKNIKIIKLQKHEDSSKFKFVENGIIEAIAEDSKWDDHFKIGISFELEKGEDSQNPLEYILDRYSVHVSEFLDNPSVGVYELELAGGKKNIQKFLGLIGKRVYERPYTDRKGIELVIEDDI